MSGSSGPAARGDLVPSAILGLLGTRGPTSRAEIARSLDINPATVTQVTKGLIARGLVTELDQVRSQGGRPARLLGLVRSAGGALGAKVTADHVAVVDVELDGSVRSSVSYPFDPDSPTALDQLADILGAAVDDHGERNLLGIGVGIPGSVDEQAVGIVSAPTLGWTDAHVGPILRSTLGVPVLVENDVNTLAVAERLYGVGRSHSSYLVVTIGRGIGCGLVVDGAVYRGAGGGAGEIGHIPITVDGPLCGCGSYGCLEAHIGDAALVRRALESGIVGPRGTSRGLLQAAEDGTEAARQIYAEAGELLGRALAGIVHTVDPEMIIILGEGIEAWQYWEPGFEAAFRRHLIPARRGLTYVVEPWAEDKWALGAAALVLASPFDVLGTSGDQGRLVRERLHANPADRAGTQP
ncbi:ROK family transcriptional regulator [Actinobacteria bacterium YIM 96077]|uniref:ROK family transcriptional regulator n=1 Tax=Phytoactinopolyspora halophila TaxID=1981511 RepID=A0A329R6Q3_9ACTN|nr:ROK family transcriptional regulator [Phytoactinopolyspora halophila]AYY12048.1 ROK family transcriptional regulator [Actinobacteria bacterium YIM 96077]RAW18718.1 ROK family transcriptional regulator [Phytoactinopolyspora halophila]